MKKPKYLGILISCFILVLGFQNCGSAQFEGLDSIQNEPLESLLPRDTKYAGGQSFNVIATSTSGTSTEFKASKKSDGVYGLIANNEASVCTLKHPNPIEELLQFNELVTVTHPSMIAEIPEVCDTVDNTERHFKIGDLSPLYLIAEHAELGCLLDDPQN